MTIGASGSLGADPAGTPTFGSALVAATPANSCSCAGATAAQTAATTPLGGSAAADAATGASLAGVLTSLVSVLQQLITALGGAIGAGSNSTTPANGGLTGAQYTANASAGSAGQAVSSVTATPTGAAVGANGAGQKASGIPMSDNGSMSLDIGTGQTTYRQTELSGGAAGRTVTIAPSGSANGLDVETYEIRPFTQGSQQTDVLVPVSGSVTIPAGSSVRLLTKVTGLTAGTHTRDLGYGTATATVGAAHVTPLPMMTWVNVANASARGGSKAGVENVLQQFGVSSSGTAGAAGGSSDMYFYPVGSAQDSKASPTATAAEIVAQEKQLQATHPGAQLWVQVADEEDKTSDQVAGAVSWIGQLRSALQADGSSAKLFVATQARDTNIAFARVVDGWATTQQDLGTSANRDSAISKIKSAAAAAGHPVEIMEYPGPGYFTGGAASGATTSVASAGLDGADAWFYFSADNLDDLNSGAAKGDDGGLVAVSGGQTYATLSLAEADYGANLAGAARATGAAGLNSSGAGQVNAEAAQMDRYSKASATPNYQTWEQQIGSAITRS